VPTVNEALGINDYELTGWFGILVPSKTPADVVARLNSEIGKILQDPAVLETIRNQGGDPLGGTAAQFEARMRRDMQRLGEVVRLSGARAN
jgi:tripartite-type tricarboxylate transporter receptor subunit TctC